MDLEPAFDERVHQLVRDWGAEKSPELIEEMIMTALKMARDEMGMADLKLMNRSLKEMRYAAKVFAAYRAFSKGVRLRFGAHSARRARVKSGRRIRAQNGRRKITWSSPAAAMGSWARPSAERDANTVSD